MQVLLVGETWATASTHFKGWDFFTSTTFHSGADAFLTALETTGVEVSQMPAHLAATDFASDVAGLENYDAVILSDIGSNTLLLHPDTWLRARPRPNRLQVLADWVRSGGGLAMVGGYMSFQGLHGQARYRDTPIEDVLPVLIESVDDRVEVPEGFRPELATAHPIVSGIEGEWPLLLGYNRVTPKDDASVLLRRGEDPILAIGTAGRGRTLAWVSDIGPHWCPPEFCSWPGYRTLWKEALEWLGSPRVMERSP